MSRAVIFHFSGTGNTRYVCRHLAAGLENRGWNVSSVSITGLEDSERDRLIEGSDTVFLAYPIYGSDMPANMRRFIASIPDGGGRALGVLCTQLAFSGDGASILFRQIRLKGYVQKWSYQVNMPNNLCIPGSPFSQSSDYDRHERKHLAKARAKAVRIAEAVDSGRRRIGDHSPFHRLLGLTQRPAYRSFAQQSYARKLDVDPTGCIGCGRCAAACPERVIRMVDGKAVFVARDTCLVCLRCLNFCPVSAVTFGGRVKEPHFKGPTPEIYREIFHQDQYRTV